MTTILRAHVQTWRPYTLWYIGLVGLAGAGLTDGRHGWWRLAAAWAFPTVGWIGGHYLGDYFDRRLDSVSKPHRPIPSGRLRPRTALACGIACLVTVTTLALAGGWDTGLLAIVAAAGIIGYGRGLKARGLAGNLVRGALGALALVYGALAVGRLSWVLAPFVVAFWARDTSSNLVGTLRDVAGDRAGGYRTVPVRHGSAVAVRAAFLLYGVTLAAAAVGGIVAAAAAGYFVMLAVAALAGLAPYRTLRAHRVRLPELTALRAHEVLVLERIWFAGAVLAIGFGFARALALLLPALALTWWTQVRMRSGYEFGDGGPALAAAHQRPATG